MIKKAETLSNKELFEQTLTKLRESFINELSVTVYASRAYRAGNREAGDTFRAVLQVYRWEQEGIRLREAGLIE